MDSFIVQPTSQFKGIADDIEAARILLDLISNEDKKSVHQELSCNVCWRGSTM